VSGETFHPRELFQALARHGVEYVTVGGVAIQAHGGQRLTQDLDVAIAASKDNLDRLAAALSDVLTLPAHLGTFADMRARAHDVPLGDVSVPIAHRDDLLSMKRASGRPQDLADVKLLEALCDE
jgi:hypothetical protein